jgi:hypothetical protein
MYLTRRSLASLATRGARVSAAFVLVTYYWLRLRLWPRAILKGAVAAGGDDGASPIPTAESHVYQIISAVDRAADLHPLRPQCLERALACAALLRRRHDDVRVVVGVSRIGASLDAHAWVEVGRQVNDAPRSTFTRLMQLR